MKIESIGKSLFAVGIIMIFMGVMMINKENLNFDKSDIAYLETNVNYVKKSSKVQAKEIVDNSELGLTNINMNAADGSLVRIEVVDHFTREEIINKLNKKLGGVLSGKGQLITDTSLKLKVDPFVAAAIMMHETGNGTSRIARTCSNVGGQKGPGCGAYRAYPDINSGIVGMINNLYRNFYSRGLTTIDSIGPRYAESGSWPRMIHSYVNMLKK
ncbi:MAG: glucosaminidase domain-containing protein [Bacilli bacterium]|nr:glucosaminidase domain-containing protein [Bacilli bacterium]